MLMKSILAAVALLAALAQTLAAADLRIGMIGLDTSHVPAFTDILNNPQNKAHVPGAKVVAAFKGGSPDIASSRDRVEGFTKTLVEKYGVKIYDSIEEMVKHVDAVFIESVDGRPHLAQAIPVIKARKPLFIDKPMAGSLKDVLEIFRLAKEARVPVWSSSSLRYSKAAQAVRGGSVGKVNYAEAASPASLEPSHPDLFWYGVHGCESLFTVMGTGCETVKRGTTADGKIEVTGKWKGGRTGIFREAKGYTGVAKGDKGEAAIGAYDGYAPLVAEAIKAFQTGVVPVSPEETIELFAFMEAADESKRRGGAEVSLAEVLKKAGK
ncbi:MAG: dehydrogenase [Pedosphaera sp. Tous-C6FEB]|nr:MAG: dehydrogenase [Pedosphaera sp. Tous-C6FEB]